MRVLNPLSLFAVVLLLGGCATNGVVQLYDGEAQPDSQIVTVQVPASLEVARINGRAVEGVNTFVGSNDKQLKLAPGRYEFVAFYKQLWTLDGDRHETLASEPQRFTVDGAPGERYRLSYAEPKTARAARALSDDFRGWVENLSTGEQQPSEDSDFVLRRGLLGASITVEEKAASSTAVIPPQQQVAPQTVAPASSAGNDGGYLDTLKAQWRQATAEERRAFLQWVAE